MECVINIQATEKMLYGQLVENLFSYQVHLKYDGWLGCNKNNQYNAQEHLSPQHETTNKKNWLNMILRHVNI